MIVHDFEEIVNDEEIKVVVEVMGGVEPAYTFVKRSLLAGKNVATSNKALVAKHGAELLAIAKEKNLNFLFEASVGGGIPIIRPLNTSLSADDIEEITGILNGTTNYMLSKMYHEDADYDAVLKEAQMMGYAEDVYKRQTLSVTIISVSGVKYLSSFPNFCSMVDFKPGVTSIFLPLII